VCVCVNNDNDINENDIINEINNINDNNEIILMKIWKW